MGRLTKKAIMKPSALKIQNVTMLSATSHSDAAVAGWGSGLPRGASPHVLLSSCFRRPTTLKTIGSNTHPSVSDHSSDCLEARRWVKTLHRRAAAVEAVMGSMWPKGDFHIVVTYGVSSTARRTIHAVPSRCVWRLCQTVRR